MDCKLTSLYHKLASMVQFILSIIRSNSAIAMEHYDHLLLVLIWGLPVLVILIIITVIIRLISTRDRPCVDPPSNPLTAPSSTSSSPPSSWDVFLSFHGGDTRGSFTAHLYKALHDAGVRTFRDEPELRTGEEISGGLFNAIHGSKMCVVVLSENFASS